MENRRALYTGLLLLTFGTTVLFIELIDQLPGATGWARWWPLLLLDMAVAFTLPLLIWRGADAPVGLAVPAALFLANGLILLYQSLTGDWASWAYLWTLELVALGGAFLLMTAMGVESGALRAVGLGFVSAGAVLLMLALSLYGGRLSLLGPLLLIGAGLLLLLRGRLQEGPPRL